MSSFLSCLDLTIRTVAPVHIGNGKTVNKREYLIDRDAMKVKFINVDKMYMGMRKLHREKQFELYLLGHTQARDLNSFFADQGILPSVYDSWIMRECEIGDPSVSSRSTENICEFIKGADGLPYIPGSSVKGMLRTILETEYFLQNKEHVASYVSSIENERYEKKKKYLQETDLNLARDAFHRDFFKDSEGRSKINDMKNDMLRGMIIGDSEPLSYGDMCLCEKIDWAVDGSQKTPNVLRECIKPQVEFKVPITIDTRICKMDRNSIYKAIQDFFVNYKKEFISKFEGAPEVKGNSTTMFLGGGVGYPSKTVTYGLMEGDHAHRVISQVIEQRLPPAVRQEHGHDKDVSLGVSPHMLKCTRYHKKYYQMGACCIVK